MKILVLMLFTFSFTWLEAQSGLHVKWVNNHEIVYYDRGGTIWLHNVETKDRTAILKGSQPAPHPIEKGTYAIRAQLDGLSRIAIVKEGNNVVLNVSDGIPAGSKAFHPIWSYDGKHLAFHAEDGPSKSTLFVYDYINKQLKSYVEDMIVGPPSFFSSGDILFTNRTGDENQLVRFNPETQMITTLFKSEHRISFSDVSKDEKTIAFSFNIDGNFDLWLLDIETKKLTQLTDAPNDEWGPRWSPDGSRIAYFAEIDGMYPAFIYNLKSSIIQEVSN